MKENPKGVSEVSDIMKELQDIAIHKDRVRTAKQLLLENLSYEKIADITKLTVAEVQNLAEGKPA